MDLLRRRALARLPMAEAEVAKVYAAHNGAVYGRPDLEAVIRDLCTSHERLRAELLGAEALLEDSRREVAAALALLDELADQFGCLGLDEARGRLRKLVPGEAKGGA